MVNMPVRICYDAAAVSKRCGGQGQQYADELVKIVAVRRHSR
jgi:hypothetical protein